MKVGMTTISAMNQILIAGRLVDCKEVVSTGTTAP
jgi:hypothetical protein